MAKCDRDMKTGSFLGKGVFQEDLIYRNRILTRTVSGQGAHIKVKEVWVGL